MSWLRSGSSGKGPKESEAAASAFLKLGELVKLERLLSGEVPDLSHSADASLYRKQPWAPELVEGDLPFWDVSSADSWGRERVVVGTRADGVRVLGGGAVSHGALVVEADVGAVTQLDVVESFELAFLAVKEGQPSPSHLPLLT